LSLGTNQISENHQFFLIKKLKPIKASMQHNTEGEARHQEEQHCNEHK